MVECQALEMKNGTKKPNILVVPQDHAVQSARSRNHFNPFISKDFVSLSEHGEKVPIDILRDTGAAQSLLVDGILPLSDSTATVQIQGIELGVVNSPLHVVHLN